MSLQLERLFQKVEDPRILVSLSDEVLQNLQRNVVAELRLEVTVKHRESVEDDIQYDPRAKVANKLMGDSTSKRNDIIPSSGG